MAFIYALVDPRTREVRYVGKSVYPRKRLRAHVAAGDLASENARDRWIGGLRFFDLAPELLLLEEAEDWGEAERRWVALFRAIGCRLANATDGGETWVDRTGAKHSPETCAKISASQLGRKLSPETRAKMRAASLGKPKTPEHAARIAIAQRGKTILPEQRAKTSATLRGRKHTPETRAKMSAAKLGRKLSPEHVAKIARGTGWTHSPETRAKISATMRARHA